MIRRGRGAGAGRAGPGPIHRGRSLSVAALPSRQLNDHRALCPRETCDAPSGSTLCWPGHRKRIFIRTLHHNRRRCSAGWHRTHGKAAPVPARPALPVPHGSAPGHRQGRTAAPTGLYVPAPLMLSRPQAGGGFTGRARRPRCAQARAGCPRPPPARRLPPARLPPATAGADRAPPVTAAVPPTSLWRPRTRLHPWASHSPPLPRADQPT